MDAVTYFEAVSSLERFRLSRKKPPLRPETMPGPARPQPRAVVRPFENRYRQNKSSTAAAKEPEDDEPPSFLAELRSVRTQLPGKPHTDHGPRRLIIQYAIADQAAAVSALERRRDLEARRKASLESLKQEFQEKVDDYRDLQEERDDRLSSWLDEHRKQLRRQERQQEELRAG